MWISCLPSFGSEYTKSLHRHSLLLQSTFNACRGPTNSPARAISSFGVFFIHATKRIATVLCTRSSRFSSFASGIRIHLVRGLLPRLHKAGRGTQISAGHAVHLPVFVDHVDFALPHDMRHARPTVNVRHGEKAKIRGMPGYRKMVIPDQGADTVGRKCSYSTAGYSRINADCVHAGSEKGRYTDYVTPLALPSSGPTHTCLGVKSPLMHSRRGLRRS